MKIQNESNASPYQGRVRVGYKAEFISSNKNTHPGSDH